MPPSGGSNSGIKMTLTPVSDFWLEHAIDTIAGNFGDRVSVLKKNKDLLKFGRSDQVNNTTGGTSIMISPPSVKHERDLYANDIDKVSGTVAGDGSSVLTVEGHTYSNGDLTFVVQDVTLAANPTTTAATLSTPLARCTRAYLKPSGTAGSPPTDLTGAIYFYDDNGGAVTISGGVPSDLTYVHMMIRAGQNNTEKAATTISSTDYWIITGAYANLISKQTGAYADVRMEIRDIKNGGSWRTLFDMTVSASGGDAFRTGYPYIIIPKNHDVRFVGLGDSATDRSVVAGMFGALATIA